MSRITVIGAGVIGLTTAHELAVAGHQVTVADSADAAVSPVAAALWFPYAVSNSPEVLTSARVAYDRLVDISRDPASGIRLRSGTVLSRQAAPDLSWTEAVPEHRRVDGGVRCTVPLAVTNVYLDWLRESTRRLGVGFTTTRFRSVDEVDADCDAVVVAAGIRSAALLGDDDTVFPIRGQVVRVANPGLTEWITDDDNPGGLTYIVPRDEDVVCGGTNDVGSWDETVHADVETAILRRVEALVPALRGQPVLSRAAGLRPARPSVRVEAVAGHARPVFANYGHGGAGFTLSWGDAARIVRLVG
jgi:D-amino-acid oxidase